MPTPLRALRRPLPLWVLVLLLTSAPALGQDSDLGTTPWTFRTRAAMSGSSDQSEPAGFTAYSGIALEAGVTRSLGRRLAVAMSLRTESREIDHEVGSDPAERLGSLELLPLTIGLQYHPPMGASLRPYAGVGACLTFAWEKSGFLDSLDVPVHVGPSIQLGLDLVLGPATLLNLDIRWNTLTLDVESGDRRLMRLNVDPMTFGLGMGFRF